MPLSGTTIKMGSGPGPGDSQGPSIQEAITEARERPLDFPAKERAAYVRRMVKTVNELKASGRTAYQIQEQLPEFKRDHPYLFEMITEHDTYDVGSLSTMLNMLDRMGDGELNHHNATVIVGQRLASKYIQPGEK